MAKTTHHYPSSQTAKKRLRRLLFIFLIGLALPIYFLLDRVYAQLENEAYFRQYNQAQVLVEQIDQQLLQLIEKEQIRPIAEYRFFNVLESPLLQSTGVKFSPLSSLPPVSEIPALIGYFQIDPDGSFHIPQLPTELNDQVVLSTEELAKRIRLKNNLRQLLAVNDNDAAMPVPNTEPSPAMISKQKYPARQVYRFDEVLSSVASESEEFKKDARDNTSRRKKTENRVNTRATVSDKILGEMNIDAEQFAKKNEQASASFSRHRQQKQPTRKSNRKELVKLPRQSVVDDYLSKGQQKIASSPYSAMAESTAIVADEIFTDTGQQANAVASKSSDDLDTAVKIFSFESEVGALQMLLLDQHLCFFRQLWYQNSRYVQGFIVDRNDFFNALLMPLVNSPQAANFSGILLGFNGQIISHFNSAESERETLIYRSSLTTPFQPLEIIVNATTIPTNTKAIVVDSLAGLLIFIVSLGLLLFYRLGASQIDLVGRQRNFISAVSHELKTPLTSIRMYGELLRSDWVVDDAKKRSYYDFIYFESERLSRLINNVLQLAQLENNQEKTSLQNISPSLLLQRLQHQLKSQIESSAFQLIVLPDGTDPEAQIQVDEDAMTQIIINLVDNAIKFSANSADKVIDLGYRFGSDQTVTFFVRDYGPGIAKKQMKKIFQLFYRSGDELTRTQPGTGIGLALVTQLAKTMNAKVDLVDRQPGAEFQVKFKILKE